MLVPALVLGVIGVILIAVARFWPRSAVEIEARSRAGVTTLSATTEVTRVVRHPNDRTWIARVDPDLPGTLDLDERRRLAEGLALVGEPWCADALALAYREEGEELRDVIVGAIAQCDGEIEPTLARALQSPRASERLLALDGFARLGQLDVLERSLADPDEPVALAAALALAHLHQDERVARYLTAIEPNARARSMRAVLALLAIA